MVKAIIVDDEPKAIQSLSWELSNFSDDIEVIRSFTNPEEAIDYIDQSAFDCLFLDIQMPTMDGFQFLGKLTNRDFAVVITTAYNEYALKALKNEAIDYLLKPIDSDDLEHTIKKIKKHNFKLVNSSKIEDVLLDFNSKFDHKKITINTDGKLIFLDAEEIMFVESDGNYCTIIMKNSQKIVITKKLKEMNAILPQEHFFRIHNSYIINLKKIKEFIKSDGYVVMESNHRIPVARQRKSDFLEKL
ncbi:LytTR family two component transcriptional regulator [Gelidibacter sediminis]|uniref:LytTR family two component transcriptional regulator n=1 Tax=Gelidibacter sediminis TaxID=1608710 RepID=A0A4R7Q8Y1_9FLAO|nr:LytTR family DNA-binding domain-containing protein [Gelidibacter sediminis]TDU43271.1 LytTR family two component transcriptional regulator [Gelidibacter sediminis]